MRQANDPEGWNHKEFKGYNLPKPDEKAFLRGERKRLSKDLVAWKDALYDERNTDEETAEAQAEIDNIRARMKEIDSKLEVK